jgi:glutathione S-transferase
MITLHGVSASPFVRKVELCLQLKGLSFNQIDVFPFNLPDAFRALSPLMKIPAFEDGDLCLADSSVICEYLDEKYPGYALLPGSAEDRAKARWLEEYADSTLISLASGIFYERLLKPLLGEVTDEARLERIIDDLLPEQFIYIESFMPEQGYLFGDAMMTADIALATHFLNAGYAGYIVDENIAPKFAAFLQRFKAEPMVVAQMQKDQAFFQRLQAKPS